jgi:ABC-type glycerol-3-phosphate transport system permease component
MFPDPSNKARAPRSATGGAADGADPVAAAADRRGDVFASSPMPICRRQLLRACRAIAFELFNNYGDVFTNSPMPRNTSWNSFKVTIPTVIGAVALSCMTGFALGGLPVQGQPPDLLHVRGGQLRAVPDPDGAGARPDRDGPLQHEAGLVLFHIAFQTGFCTLFMRNFIRALPFELIEAARVEGVANGASSGTSCCR